MARLDGRSVAELEDALVELDGYRETRRLLVAIMYKRGPSVPMLAEWLDVREATIYRWFDRLEREPIPEAIRDEPRPGRPPKLSDHQRERFQSTLEASPANVGYEASTWTTALARQYLREEFDVEYSHRHVRRLTGDVLDK